MKKFILILLTLLIISNQIFSQVKIKEGVKIISWIFSGPKPIPLSKISQTLYGTEKSLPTRSIIENSIIYSDRKFYSPEKAKSLGKIDYSTSTIWLIDDVLVVFNSENFKQPLTEIIEKGIEDAVKHINTKPPPFIDEEIGKYQWLLMNRNYYYKKIDGIIGPDTKMAIKAFQIDEGITVTGELNKETKTLIDKYLNSNTTVSNLDLPIQKDELSEYYEILYRLGYLKEEVSNIYYVQNLTRPILDFQIENSLTETGRLNEETKKLLAQIKQEKEEFISVIPNELLSKASNEQITTTQSNLNKLGYYEGKIDGFYGPLTEKAIKRFENDYALTGIRYDFQFGVDNIIVNLEIKKGKDFLEYWDSRINRVENKCDLSICLSKDKIAISIDCNGLTIGITTKGEITLTATNGQDTFEKTFNEATPKPSCSIDWKLCISKMPSGEISVCNLTLSASGNSQLNLSAKNGNRSKSISLL